MNGSAWGLSPCVRGHHYSSKAKALKMGSIPVCTGPPRDRTARIGSRWVYPRVYGATLLPILNLSTATGLSPCVRGHRQIVTNVGEFLGSIPVCTGPPLYLTS